MFATQLLPEECFESESKKDDESALVAFIVAEDKQFEIRKGENKIGRDPALCSIVLSNNTVSKLHAVIESEGRDDTFIHDVGSTNSVRLGKISLKPHYRYKLDNGSVIVLGNVVAKFILPPKTSDAPTDSILEKPAPQGENNLELEDLGDIFDVDTQINIPQPTTSKSEDSFRGFKLPNSPPSVRQHSKNSLEICGNTSGNENKLESDETKKPDVLGLSATEYSNIFSLETQAQIDISPKIIEKTTEAVLNKSDEKTVNPEKVNSLLNDGQDDIFCTFMSMCSPKRKDESTSHEVVIKAEPKEEPEEVFEAQTQIDSQSNNSGIEKEIALLTEELQKNTNFVEEFFEQAQNDSYQIQLETEKQKASINLTNNAFKNNTLTLGTKVKLEKGENSKKIDSQENCGDGFTQIRSQDEDLIPTQKLCRENLFNSTGLNSKVDNPLLKDSSENSDTESCLEVELENSPRFDKRKTDSSDFIYPVKFMEFDEVKKNSGHLFQGDFENVINGKSIKKELDGDNGDKNVERSHEGNSDEDDTESFLEITFEDLPKEDKTPDKVKKESTSKEEAVKEENSSAGEKSEKPIPEQSVSAKPNNESINDNEDDFEDFIQTQLFDNRVKTVTPNGDNDETQLFEPPAFQNLNGLTKDTINVNPGRSSPDLLSDEDFISTQPFNDGNAKSSKPFSDVFSGTRRKGTNSKTGQVVSILESSDDETEPYLNLQADHDEKSHWKEKNISELNESKNSNGLDHHNRSRSLLLEENETSNSSYVFELEEEDRKEETDLIAAENVKLEGKRDSWEENKPPVCMDSDSDATDCEEIDVIQARMMPIKEEVIEKVSQAETQVLTLTLPDNFAERQYNKREDGWMRGDESPKFETIRESDDESNHLWSQLSLKMPSTPDVEMTLKKLLENGNEKVPNQNGEDKRPKPSTYDQILLQTKKTEPQNSTKKTEPQTSTALQTLARCKLLGEGESKRLFDSPVKRNRDKDSTVEVVPVKKSRTSIKAKIDSPSSSGGQPVTSTQKILLKLWQTHDIAQIQPTRTRSSSKNMEAEVNPDKNKVTDNKFNDEKPNSRRSRRLGSANKRQKTDMNPNIHKKVEEAKKSFQSERKRNSNKRNERLSTEEKSESSAIGVPRNTKRNGCNVMRLNNSFDGTSGFEINGSNNSSRTFSKTVKDNSCSFHVVFTGFDCESLEQIISDLGGKRTNDLSSGTVVVADKVRRTVKFLCAIGLGLPITSPQWLWLSKKANKFLNPWDHLLKEEESEEKWDFDLRNSLERSKKKKLLEGYSVFATENAKPPFKDLLAIVECCGGIPLIHHPEKWPKNTIIVSCLEDENSWPSSKLRNVKIVHYEFILSGVLRQKIDFKTYKLR